MGVIASFPAREVIISTLGTIYSLGGDVGEDVWIGVNSLRVNGRIGGNVTAEVGGEDSAPPVDPYQFMPGAPAMPVVPSGLTVDDAAEIGGDFTYRSPLFPHVSVLLFHKEFVFLLQFIIQL